MNLDVWIAILSTTGFAAMITNAFSAFAVRGGKIKKLSNEIRDLEKQLTKKELECADILNDWDHYWNEVEHILWKIKRDFRDQTDDEYDWPEFPDKPKY